MEMIEEIDSLSDDDRVDEHGDADGLPHNNIDAENGTGDGNGSRSVQDPEGFGHTEIQYVPRRGADVGLDRQINAESVDKQADGGKQHIEDDRPGRPVVTESGIHGEASLY